jgi:hypothetical protein
MVASRDSTEVRKLTDGCLGAFHSLNRRMDAQDDKMNVIHQRLQRVEIGINAILDRLPAGPPVANQPAVPPAAINGEEEVETVEGECCVCCDVLLRFFTYLIVVSSSSST